MRKKKTYNIRKDNAGDVFVKIEGDLAILLKGMSKSIDRNGAVTVGLHKDAQAYSDVGAEIPSGRTTNVVLVGAVHEYGWGSMPARRWLSKSLRKDKKMYNRLTRKALEILPDDPFKYKNMMGKIGKIAVDKVVFHVERNDIGMKPNKKSTIARKGHSIVMVDSGHMLNQVAAKYASGEEIT